MPSLAGALGDELNTARRSHLGKSAVNEQQNTRKVMNDKFDQLAKGLAQSVTRRQALKKFGVGLAGMALACFGLVGKVEARNPCLHSGAPCKRGKQCCIGVCNGGVCG